MVAEGHTVGVFVAFADKRREVLEVTGVGGAAKLLRDNQDVRRYCRVATLADAPPACRLWPRLSLGVHDNGVLIYVLRDELGFGGFVASDNNANSQFAGAATDDDHRRDRPE